MSLQFTELRLYNAAASSYQIIPDFTTVAFDVKHNDLGAISFGYPTAKAAAIGLTDNALIGVVGTNGTADPKEFERYLVYSTKTDKIVDGTPVRTFEGKATLNFLEDASVYPSNWDPVTKTGTLPPGHEFVDNKIGTIWRTLILRAKTRGCFPNLVETTFDGLAGSDGVAWNAIVSQNYGTGENYMQMLMDQMSRGLVDAWMDGWNLRMQNGGTRGVHIAQGTLELRAAKNVTDISISTDTTDSASTIFIAGDDGVAIERHSAPAQTALGRRRERSISQSGISDIGTLTILGDAELATAGRIPTEETIGVSAVLTPFFDFNIADWVWVRFDGDQDAVERRIWQIAVGVDENRVTTVGITANSILYEDDIKTKRKIDAYTGSAGSYGSVSSGVDGSIPNAPTVGVPTSDVYLTQQGGYASAVLLNWTAPTTNVGGGTITDLDHFEYGWKYNAESTYSDLETTATPGRISPVLPGTLINLRVRAVDTSGNKSAYVYVNHTTATDTTPPPQPSTPVLSRVQYGVNVYYDGLTSSAGAMPADFDYVEIWHSASAINFVPGTAGTTLAGTMRAGTRTIAGEAFGTPTYVRLVTVDKAGNKSINPSTGASSQRGSSGDGTNPLTSPVPVLQAFGINSLEWSVIPASAPNPDSVRYRVWIDTVAAVTTDDAHLVADTPDRRGIIEQFLGGPLIPASSGSSGAIPSYFAKVQQYDADGSGPISAASAEALPRRAATHELSADAAFFGEVQAEKIVGKFLNGRFVIGNEIATDEVGRDRTGLNNDGFFSEQYSTYGSGTLTNPLTETTLSFDIGSAAASLTDFPYAIVVNIGAVNEERMAVLSAPTGTTITVERSSTPFAHAAAEPYLLLQASRSVDIPNTGDPTFRGQLEAKSALFREGFETRGLAVGATSSALRLNASLSSPATAPIGLLYQKSRTINLRTPPAGSGIVASSPIDVGTPVWDPTANAIITPVWWAAAPGSNYSSCLWFYVDNQTTQSWVQSNFTTTPATSQNLRLLGATICANSGSQRTVILFSVDGSIFGMVGFNTSAAAAAGYATYTEYNGDFPTRGMIGSTNLTTICLGGDGSDLWFTKTAPSDGTHDGVTGLLKGQVYGFRITPTFPTGSIGGNINKRARFGQMYDGPPQQLRSVMAQRSTDAGKPWADYGAWIASTQQTGTVVTVKTNVPHTFVTGLSVQITGALAAHSGTYTVTSVPDATTFTFTKATATVALTPYAAGIASAGVSGEVYITLVNGETSSFGYGTIGLTYRIPSGSIVGAQWDGLGWYGDRGGACLVPSADPAAPWDNYFWAMSASSSRMIRWAHNKKGGVYKIGYTWSDDNPTGLRHESGLSTMADFTVFARYETRLQSAAIPVPYDYPNTPATADDPNGARFYVRDPASGASIPRTWRVGSGNGHVGAGFGTAATLTIDDQIPLNVDAPAYSVDTGLTRAPLSNSFASSTLLTPFRIYSDAGGFEVKGDGTGDWPLLRSKINAERPKGTYYQSGGTVNFNLSGATRTIPMSTARATPVGITWNGTDSWTLTKAGRYLVTAMFLMGNHPSSSVAGRLTVALTSNGTRILFDRVYRTTNEIYTLVLFGTFDFAAGTVLQLEGEQSSGVTLGLNTGSSAYNSLGITMVDS